MYETVERSAVEEPAVERLSSTFAVDIAAAAVA
jgi:hypothetical protein